MEHFQKVISEGQNFHMVIPEVHNLSISDTKKIMRTPVSISDTLKKYFQIVIP